MKKCSMPGPARSFPALMLLAIGLCMASCGDGGGTSNNDGAEPGRDPAPPPTFERWTPLGDAATSQAPMPGWFGLPNTMAVDGLGNPVVAWIQFNAVHVQ